MMRKIYLFLIALPLFFLVACESGEGDYEVQKSINVVSADLTFQPSGGTGTVVVETQGTVTAVSSRPWCTTSVNGGTITVTVSEYDGLDNRYADILITSGEGTAKVTAHQYGLYFLLPEAEDSYHVEDVNGFVEIPLTHNNYEPESEADVDWLSASYADGKVIIKATDNTTGLLRTGNITIGTKKIKIEQWSFDSVFAGEYYWVGTTTATGSKVDTMKVNFKDYDPKDGTFKMDFPDAKVSLVTQFNEKDLSFKVSGALYCGETVYKDTKAYIYTIVYADGYVSWSSSYYVTFTLALDKTTGKYQAPMVDMGSWANKKISSVQFELFKSQTLNSTNRWRVAVGKKLYNVTLYKK